MDESLEGLAWLRSQLEGESAVTALLALPVAYAIQAPQGAPLPYCVVTPMGGKDATGVAGARLLYEGTYQVRFWGYATESDALAAAGDAADALLQRTRGATARASILSCIRDRPLPVLPDWDGQQLRIGVGGLYRLQVCKLP